MDETAVSVRGGAHYLYRAVDKYGKTVDSLLCVDRSESAARTFFNKALKTHQPQRPQKVNLDGNAASHRALRVLRQEWRSVLVRSNRYLNNIVEQDHRAIALKAALGKDIFIVTTREWEIARKHMSRPGLKTRVTARRADPA
jgi:transposase-like protein